MTIKLTIVNKPFENAHRILLESYVDAYGMVGVLTALSEIAGEKAEHVATNWQDTKLADRWSSIAICTADCAVQAEELGV